jgi:hypothetical protein
MAKLVVRHRTQLLETDADLVEQRAFRRLICFDLVDRHVDHVGRQDVRRCDRLGCGSAHGRPPWC